VSILNMYRFFFSLFPKYSPQFNDGSITISQLYHATHIH
jgi:hypothetical protein